MECINGYYIHNFKLIESSKFNEEILIDGTSIYEVIRIEQGIPVFLEDHLNRLFYSAELSNLNIDESYCDFETLIEQLILKNKIKQGKIKIVVHFNTNQMNLEKNVLIYFTQHYFPSEQEIKTGVKSGLCRATRINPNAKILNTNARLKANNIISENKFFEVLLLDDDGFITEGSRSNVFFIKGDTLYTPPNSDILMGISRKNVIELCSKNNIKINEKKIHRSEISEIDSVFISGTSLKVLPLRTIDNDTFNPENKILLKLIELFNFQIQSYVQEKLT